MKRVGIIPSYSSNENANMVSLNYTKAIEKSGAIPVIFPLTDNIDIIQELILSCDGILFMGGPDISPSYYHEEKHEKLGYVCDIRDKMEKIAFGITFQFKKPILGICRGIQAINVFLNGTLYQDIPSQYETTILHQMQPPYNFPGHYVNVCKETPFDFVFEQEHLGVNSYHHQAIKKLGDGLKEAAISEDGLIEAVYYPNYPFLFAVQWHPEKSFDFDKTSQNIFKAFIKAMEK